ncbi:hypothetical protein Ddc_01614 [Ditylenchus destructor]|nr:hypothetical protein Ddc_01614 [Ditylenchus destructor]
MWPESGMDVRRHILERKTRTQSSMIVVDWDGPKSKVNPAPRSRPQHSKNVVGEIGGGGQSDNNDTEQQRRRQEEGRPNNNAHTRVCGHRSTHIKIGEGRGNVCSNHLGQGGVEVGSFFAAAAVPGPKDWAMMFK